MIHSKGCKGPAGPGWQSSDGPPTERETLWKGKDFGGGGSGEVEGDDVKAKEGSRKLKLKILHYKTVFLN